MSLSALGLRCLSRRSRGVACRCLIPTADSALRTGEVDSCLEIEHKIDNAMWSAARVCYMQIIRTPSRSKTCAHVQEHTIYVNLHDVRAASMHSLSTSRSNTKSTMRCRPRQACHACIMPRHYINDICTTTQHSCLRVPERGSDAGLHGKTIATNSDREYNRSEVGITWHERFKSVSYTRLTRGL